MGAGAGNLAPRTDAVENWREEERGRARAGGVVCDLPGSCPPPSVDRTRYDGLNKPQKKLCAPPAQSVAFFHFPHYDIV